MRCRLGGNGAKSLSLSGLRKSLMSLSGRKSLIKPDEPKWPEPKWHEKKPEEPAKQPEEHDKKKQDVLVLLVQAKNVCWERRVCEC